MSKRKLLNQIVCPHCWTSFPAEDILTVAEDPKLYGDSRLGQTEQKRFLPTEFDEYGEPLDLNGRVCHNYACPNCHLNLPACALEAAPLFMSIAGAPGCGKSFYLAAVSHLTPGALQQGFNLNFTEPDPAMNARLTEYRNRLFINASNTAVTLDKTQEQGGGLYDSVDFDGVETIFPKPFVFNISPSPSHPIHANDTSLMRTIYLYDNAGESYLPRANADPITLPVTRHLTRSAAIFFLFDPTQDDRFRNRFGLPGSPEALHEESRWTPMSPDEEPLIPNLVDDPSLDQDSNKADSAQGLNSANQETVVAELIRRLRSYRRMGMHDRFKEPFIVIVSKADVWGEHADLYLDNEPVALIRSNNKNVAALRTGLIKKASSVTRAFLKKYSPALVANVEAFADNVIYIPVSATGRKPETDVKTGQTGFRPQDLKPKWVTVPFLYAMARLIPDSVAILDK